jgi:hypothetical protein
MRKQSGRIRNAFWGPLKVCDLGNANSGSVICDAADNFPQIVAVIIHLVHVHSAS